MMKKYIGLSLVLSVNALLIGGDEPKKPISPQNSQSLRASTDALKIAVTKVATEATKNKKFEGFSSGSSPAGAGHLYPGQPGNGLLMQIAPVNPTDEQYYWWS